MVVWRRAGIDFVHLLQLQHTSVGQSKSPATIAIQSATRNSLIFLVVFIIFNKSIHFALRHGYSMTFAHSLPVLLTIYFLWSAFHPWKSRKVWWEMLARVLMAPACPVIFRDGFIGDILTSLVRVLIPFAFSLLYLLLSVYAWVVNDLSWTVSMSDKWWTTNPILHFVLIPFLTIYPLWIRLLQCLRRSVESGHRWPHLANASKYASAIIVISLATFRPEYRGNWLWVLALVGATLFQYSWDLTQDWGMLCFSVPETKENCSFADVSLSFRAKRLLGPSWVYVSVMITNLALRFAWTLTLLPPPNEEDGLTVYNLVTKHVGPILAAAEIVRRMVWGFFRLEFEQIEFLQRANPAKDMDLLDIEMVSTVSISLVAGLTGAFVRLQWPSIVPLPRGEQQTTWTGWACFFHRA